MLSLWLSHMWGMLLKKNKSDTCNHISHKVDSRCRNTPPYNRTTQSQYFLSWNLQHYTSNNFPHYHMLHMYNGNFHITPELVQPESIQPYKRICYQLKANEIW